MRHLDRSNNILRGEMPQRNGVDADMQNLYDRILSNERFAKNMEWGGARPGHPEATLARHVACLDNNLQSILQRFGSVIEILGASGITKVKILNAVHDAMKPDSKRGVPIDHPKSHASIAARFLRDIGGPNELAVMVQWHDEPHALYRQSQRGGEIEGRTRLGKLLALIPDWDVFLIFQACDKVCPGRDLESTRWLVNRVRESYVEPKVPIADIVSFLAEKHGLVEELGVENESNG